MNLLNDVGDGKRLAGTGYTQQCLPLNLNTATKEQLVSAGLDEALASGILELRNENDEFVDIEELLEVDGMDPKKLRELRKKLYVEAAKGCNC